MSLTNIGFMEFITMSTRCGTNDKINTTVIINSIKVTCFVRKLGPLFTLFSLLFDSILLLCLFIRSIFGVDSLEESRETGELERDFSLADATFFIKSPYGSFLASKSSRRVLLVVAVPFLLQYSGDSSATWWSFSIKAPFLLFAFFAFSAKKNSPT